MSRVARHSSEADIGALAQLCEQLSGFGADIALEWLDGYMTALLASRRAIPVDEWRPAMLGDAFDRAFGDPESAAAAQAVLTARWQALASQLDVESLLEAPDELRLAPLLVSYDDAARQEMVAEGEMSAEDAHEWLQDGALWAEGFLQAVGDFEADWQPPETPGDDSPTIFEDGLDLLLTLALPKSECDAKLAEMAGSTKPWTREELIDEACFAVQDLRLFWLDHAPKPATRHVAPQPGRNDPCHCGSGKKFKKCHGAATN